MEFKKGAPIIGTVTSRQCPECGHHEVGITTREGTFLPLRPGTLVQIMETLPEKDLLSKQHDLKLSKPVGQTDGPPSVFVAWVPDPARGDRSLRLKYGVMISPDPLNGQIKGDDYLKAYLDKLSRLLEKETSVPVAVVLDKFFAAPHLASGTPKEIALAMWRELEEIRIPALLVKEWLEDPGEENLAKLIRPATKEGINHKPVTEEDLEKELNELTLEDFLGLLT